jgi:hypothetical protein
MAEKNMVIALIISFIFTGLGIAYAGDIKKGVGIFAVAVLLNILGMWVNPLFSIISLVLWIAGLYLTYQEVKMVNG